MSDLSSIIYGPLDKGSCVYFLILTVFFFIILVISFFANLFVLIKDRKNLTFRNIIGGIYMVFSIFIAYFVNRLLHTMCIVSVH